MTSRSLKNRFLLPVITALAGLVLLAACSQIQLGYNNADTLLHYYITDYVSIRPDQEDDLRARLERFHAWHRQKELPEYAEFARMASERLSKGITLQDAQFALTTFREHYKQLLSHAIDDAVPLMHTFDARQIAELEAEFDKGNRKYLDERKERESDAPAERLEKRVERLQGTYEDWLGSLTTAQKVRIAEAVKNMPDMGTFRYAERVRNQQAFLSLLRSRAPTAEMSARLRALLADPDALRDPQYKAAMAASEKIHMQLAVDLNQMLAPAQRSHVAKRFSGYAEDFAKLSTTTKLAQK